MVLDQHASPVCCAAGFVTVSVRRDELELSFFGLDGQQPMYTAAVPRRPSATARDSAADADPMSAWRQPAGASAAPESATAVGDGAAAGVGLPDDIESDVKPELGGDTGAAGVIAQQWTAADPDEESGVEDLDDELAVAAALGAGEVAAAGWQALGSL